MKHEQSFPKSVIFDLDGTLIDSVPAIAATLNNVFRSRGAKELNMEEVKELVGFVARGRVGEMIERRGCNVEPGEFNSLREEY